MNYFNSITQSSLSTPTFIELHHLKRWVGKIIARLNANLLHSSMDRKISFTFPLCIKKFPHLHIITSVYNCLNGITFVMQPTTLNAYGNNLNLGSPEFIKVLEEVNRNTQSSINIIYKSESSLFEIKAFLPLSTFQNQCILRLESYFDTVHSKMEKLMSQILHSICSFSPYLSQKLQPLKKIENTKEEYCFAKSAYMLKYLFELHRKERQNSTKKDLISNGLIAETVNSFAQLYGDRIRRLKQSFEFNLEEAENLFQKTCLSQINSMFEKKNIQNEMILRAIEFKQDEIQRQVRKMEVNGNFGQIDLVLDKFVIKFSVHKETAEQFEMQSFEKYQNFNQNKKMNEVQKIKLIKKTPLIYNDMKKMQNSQQSFDIEKKILFSLHNRFCSQIASYYFQFGYTDFNCKALYSEYYKKSFDKIGSVSGALKIILNLAYGLKFLKQQNIIHRDIKPQNIRVTPHHIPKIIDFGSSAFVNSQNQEIRKIFRSKLRCTNGYYAQYCKLSQSLRNIYKQDDYNMHLNFDLYSFGKIIMDLKQMGKLDEKFYASLEYVMKKCMEYNPEDRLTHQEIITYVKFVILSSLQKN